MEAGRNINFAVKEVDNDIIKTAQWLKPFRRCLTAFFLTMIDVQWWLWTSSGEIDFDRLFHIRQNLCIVSLCTGFVVFAVKYTSQSPQCCAEITIQRNKNIMYSYVLSLEQRFDIGFLILGGIKHENTLCFSPDFHRGF